MNKRIVCNSKEFKYNLMELCGDCPLILLIQKGIKTQIIREGLEKKEILTKKQFEKYIAVEVKNASDAMQHALLIEKQFENNPNDIYRKKRIELYIWNKERIKSLNNLMDTDSELKNTYPFYCKVGSLFAQGLVQKVGFLFYFREEEFSSANKLSIYVQKVVLKTNRNTQQYINDTLNNLGEKNFYKSKKMMNNIYDFCEDKNIDITDDFKSRHTHINKLH